ncbi:MAG: hypothetical protein OEV49_17200 [candidate division Zixibacteria bacterium]|nr:hypothetical protein [candidate division Zixibacteria bacterium]MDH3939138.1 hypothetical protein [candidate division Zixibacteria bacterium]MDH4034022.1 hypothetical protein [candidate division Zixibacteria bacterium]
MTSKLKSTTGVTMVELLALAVIVGIIASMSVPRFQRAYERLQFRSANRDIVSTLRLARSMSIADKLQYGVYFDFYDRTMTLFQDINNPDTYTFESNDRVVRVDTLEEHVEYVFTDLASNTITFGPNGSAGFTGGGNILTIGLVEEYYYETFHNVLRSTGRVRSYDNWELWAQQHAEGA